jgi:hypothetical protein
MAFELQIESRALSDITTRVLRVAGTFSGPIGSVQRAGSWALATAGRVTSIYRVTHSPDDGRSLVECSCVPHE